MNIVEKYIAISIQLNRTQIWIDLYFFIDLYNKCSCHQITNTCNIFKATASTLQEDVETFAYQFTNPNPKVSMAVLRNLSEKSGKKSQWFSEDLLKYNIKIFLLRFFCTPFNN